MIGINTLIETSNDDISQILKFFNIIGLLYKKKNFSKVKVILCREEIFNAHDNF